MTEKFADAIRWLGVVSLFLMLNIAFFIVTSWFGDPTAIAGLRWTLEYVPPKAFPVLLIVSIACYFIAEKISPDPVAGAWRKEKARLRAERKNRA